MGGRFVAVFRDAPLVFFGVVIGVALLFRLGVGSAREAMRPDDVAPTFANASTARGAASASAGTSPSAAPSFAPDPDAKPISEARRAEIGAAGRVQPLGSDARADDARPPSPARVAPKPRGHGRRPIR